MKVSLQTKKIVYPQKEVPPWSKTVERWYQLDAYAFSFCEALFEYPQKDFNWMVLASPGASTETDFHFTQSETPSPQKFVHTLPNVRAAMALQSIGKKSELICLQNAPYTIHDGIEEFLFLASEKKNPLFASCLNLDFDYSSQSPKTYGVLTLSPDENGDWELRGCSSDKLTDQQIAMSLFDDSQTKIQLGQWMLEKISGQ